MRSAPVHILLLVLACLCAGCARRGKVIPAEKMVRIYEDMFLADQWIRENPDARVAADTTYFFDPIFNRHGYTFEDYDLSVHYYLDRPEKYSKILGKASELLRRENERLNKELAARNAVEQERNRLHALYKSELDFQNDSLFRDEPDILWPVRIADTLAVADTLAFSDTVAAADSLAVRDSIAIPGLIELPKPVRIRKTDH